MLKRIAAIIFIFLCSSVAWAILGGTVFSRTYSSDSHLKDQVSSSWGTSQNQTAPHAGYTVMVSEASVTSDANGVPLHVTKETARWMALPTDKSRVSAD